MTAETRKAAPSPHDVRLELPVIVQGWILPTKADPSSMAGFANGQRAEAYASLILPDYQFVTFHQDGEEQGRLTRVDEP